MNEGNRKPLLAYISSRVQYINWHDLVYVLDRPWKGRLWTYQKILLASKPVIVCGIEHTGWSDFEWTLLLLRKTFGYLPSAAIAWEGIALDRGKVSSTIRPAEPNVLHSLEQNEAINKRILLARRVLKTTLVCLVLTCLMTLLLVGVVSICSWKYPSLGIRFQLAKSTENVFMVISIVGIPGWLFHIWLEVRPLYQGDRGDIHETASDDLVGALYRRAASDPRDMAYGIWAILRKLGASDLPLPTYDADSERQLPSIYRQLTVSLMQVTGNLRTLHVAAARGLPGTPSWVPDWSSIRKNMWRELPGFPGTDLNGIYEAASLEAKERLRRQRALQRISMDPTLSVLTVLARDVGAICDCAFFRLTGKAFEVDERNSHLENLRAMLLWTQWAKDIGCFISATSYTQPSREFAPQSAEATWPSLRDRRNWAKLLFKPRSDKLETYLTRFLDGFRVPRWFRNFLTTQICLCNLIAEMKRKICYTSIPDQLGKFYLLACSEETQVDDRVILVCGLPGTIVVRKRDGSQNSVSIISPTQSHGQGMIKKPKSTNEDNNANLESQFIEYHIH